MGSEHYLKNVMMAIAGMEMAVAAGVWLNPTFTVRVGHTTILSSLTTLVVTSRVMTAQYQELTHAQLVVAALSL